MATNQNLYINQGATYVKSFTIQNEDLSYFDLTNYTGRGQIRKEYASNAAVDFIVTLGGNTGVVTLGLSANVSANLVNQRYVYDVEVESNTGIVTRILQGFALVSPEVTR